MAIESANKGIETDEMVMYIIKEMSEMEYKHYTIQWVPGHTGIKNNEIVDKLAKQAITIGDETMLHTPRNDIIATLKKEIKHTLSLRLENSNVGWYKNIVHSFCPQPWYKNLNWTRAEIKNICKLRIGHVNTNKRLYKKKLYFTPLCLKCTLGVEESITHILKECPSYDYVRRNNFNDLNRLSMQEILESNNLTSMKLVYTFLKQTQRHILLQNNQNLMFCVFLVPGFFIP